MLRECDINDISDGRLYGLNDMVKVDTLGCAGCHKCCTGMGNSIVLDPYDVYLLKRTTKKGLQDLLNEGYIELNMVDGLILPNLKMNEKGGCSFLNEQGRCCIHEARPGICRLFPLGRVYDGQGFSYFIQKDECIKDNKAKIKLKKWIDVVAANENYEYICRWHYFIRDIGNLIIRLRDSGRGENINDIAMYVLNAFFVSDVALDNYDEKNGFDEVEKTKYIYSFFIDKVKKAEEALKPFM